MPVDRGHHRFGQHGDLGALTLWDCPACGKKNEGRRPEQGCGHCGAGDPEKGQPAQPGPTLVDRVAAQADRHPFVMPAMPATPSDLLSPSPAEATVVYRLIEYRIHPGHEEAARETLQRSLVGTLHTSWGELTGSIVDEVSERQEDVLRLMKRQPGVWLGNATLGGGKRQPMPQAAQRGDVDATVRAASDQYSRLWRERERAMMTPPTSTQRVFLDVMRQLPMRDAATADESYRLLNTLALALQSIAPELDGNSEPLKWLSSREALQLAEALLQAIPDEWDPQLPAAPAAGEGEESSNG